MTGWRTVALGDIAASIDYGVTASASHEPVGPRFLRITDIQQDSVDWESVPWCDCDKATAAAARLQGGDIVFARTGATTGKSFLLRETPENAVFASYLIRVRLLDGIDPGFVSQFFKTPWYWTQVAKTARGIAQPGVNATSLRSLVVPLPPLSEQRRIAAILDRTDDLRAKRRRALEQLNGLTAAIFVEMFGDPITNLSGFPISRMGDVCDVRDGTHDSPKYVSEGGFPLVTSKNLSGGTVDLKGVNFISEADYEQINKRSRVERGDLVMPMIGTIGSPVLVEDEPHFAIKNVALVKFREDSPSAVFVRQLLRPPYFDHVLGLRSRGGTQKFVSLSDLRDFPIPLPPSVMQKEFEIRVASVEGLRTSSWAFRRLLDVLLVSVQHRAFTGTL